MKILLQDTHVVLTDGAVDRETGRTSIWFPSCGAIVGQAILAALLSRLLPQALASIKESHPEDPKLGGAGELLVTVTVAGKMPAWALEIYAWPAEVAA